MADKCDLLKDQNHLAKALKSKKELFVLFYASWCPYSQVFLPNSLEANANQECHMRTIVDEEDPIWTNTG